MRFYARVLGYDGEPVLPAKEVPVDGSGGPYEVQWMATDSVTVIRAELHNSEGGQVMTHTFSTPHCLTPGCHFVLKVFIGPS